MVIRVFHIGKDDKFFNDVFRSYMDDERLSNRAAIIKGDVTKPLEYVKQSDEVTLMTLSSLKPIFKEGNYDVVFFHSISESMWRVLDWIPKDKVIIWWGWGYDLYNSRIRYFKPLITVPLYKPMTRKVVDSIEGGKHSKDNHAIVSYIKALCFEYYRKKNIKRIDYFRPVIHIEYDMLCSIKRFRAQEFAPRNVISNALEFKPNFQLDEKKVLLGNSAFPTNNHIDVWNKIKEVGILGKHFILPLSYGEINYREAIEKDIVSDCNVITFVHDYMPRAAYMDLLGSCAFAIFGVLRQQAMGNIFACLQKGVKVFLYEDSIVYKYLRNTGYVVFSIDNMTPEDLETPLPFAEAKNNFDTFIQSKKQNRALYEQVISDIYKRYE